MEGFASCSGLLPEQIWDEPDRPKSHLYFGKPTGSATPLVWAHAEYIKLLRSATEGKVFDLIPAVADRYQHRRSCKPLEVWKPNRHVGIVQTGTTLRIQVPAPFRLHWTVDEWQSANDTPSTATAVGIHFVDIPVVESIRAAIRFTFFWPRSGHWEGRDYHVDIDRVESGHIQFEPTEEAAGPSCQRARAPSSKMIQPAV
jgi:glucoamylase